MEENGIMAIRNILMNYYNGNGYDELYPQTTLSNVSDWESNLYSKTEVDKIKNSLETSINSMKDTLETLSWKFLTSVTITNNTAIVTLPVSLAKISEIFISAKLNSTNSKEPASGSIYLINSAQTQIGGFLIERYYSSLETPYATGGYIVNTQYGFVGMYSGETQNVESGLFTFADVPISSLSGSELTSLGIAGVDRGPDWGYDNIDGEFKLYYK